MSPEAYEEDKLALRLSLCGYFNSDTGKGCLHRQRNAVCPMDGVTATGGKKLKVCWSLPGMGKSGGLRFAVVAYCEQKRVKLVGAWFRKSDPSDAEFAVAFQRAT
jgi:hypothetical protein